MKKRRRLEFPVIGKALQFWFLEFSITIFEVKNRILMLIKKTPSFSIIYVVFLCPLTFLGCKRVKLKIALFLRGDKRAAMRRNSEIAFNARGNRVMGIQERPSEGPDLAFTNLMTAFQLSACEFSEGNWLQV